MKKLFLAVPILLAGCVDPSAPGLFSTLGGATNAVALPPEMAAPPETLDPTPPPPPPPMARTVEQFDTTSAEDRAEAVAAEPESGERSLGTTLTTLGSPTDPGIWLKTPLVSELQMGRATYGQNGRTIALELRPSGGASGSGSQLSLAAMRLLDAPLTEVVEIEVLAGG